MIKYLTIIPLILFLNTCKQRNESAVIATSAWTAAYAEAAGIRDVVVLAPSGMQHPTEYELEIDDILKIRDASLIISGGYEIMMEKIRSGLKVEPEKILQIKTDYNFEHMQESITLIAEKFEIKRKALSSIEEIKKAFEESREKLREAGYYDETFLVQFFIQSYAREMGLDIVDIFGPAHLEVFDIQDIMKKEFTIILDNEHNPVAGPIIESKENIKVAYLINFPGSHDTHSLVDVIRYNTARIIEAENSKELQIKN